MASRNGSKDPLEVDFHAFSQAERRTSARDLALALHRYRIAMAELSRQSKPALQVSPARLNCVEQSPLEPTATVRSTFGTSCQHVASLS